MEIKRNLEPTLKKNILPKDATPRSLWLPTCIMNLLSVEKAIMLPSTKKLRVGLALSPELIAEADRYAVPFGVSRSLFFEEAMWIYLNHLDKYVQSEAKPQTQNEEALAAA